MNEQQPAPPDDDNRRLATIVYALQAAGFIIGITFIAAVVLNYIKREDVAGTWIASHFRWQIRTFWFGLLWSVIGAFTAFVGVGFAILFANTVWVIYRIIKGWLRLSEGREMPFDTQSGNQ
ncbi:MAG: hypothetical protein Q9M29_01130 [Mariprofundaceae bacterium]|nr:hypothetical protein [Mariprofundaceae bacterium]